MLEMSPGSWCEKFQRLRQNTRSSIMPLRFCSRKRTSSAASPVSIDRVQQWFVKFTWIRTSYATPSILTSTGSQKPLRCAIGYFSKIASIRACRVAWSDILIFLACHFPAVGLEECCLSVGRGCRIALASVAVHWIPLRPLCIACNCDGWPEFSYSHTFGRSRQCDRSPPATPHRTAGPRCAT